MATIALAFSGDESPTGVSVTALTRTDTGATVPGVTLPAAMTLVDGEWVLDFTEPAAGLTYAYTYKIAWSDGTFSEKSSTLTGEPSDTYSTDSDLDNAYGRDNVTAWADLNDNGNAGEIAARKAWARDVAYREMNDAMRAEGLTIPATYGSFLAFSSLPDIEAQVAGFYLHRSRGVSGQQTTGLNADEIQDNYNRAIARLAGLITAQVELDEDDTTSAPGTFGSVNLRFEPECTGDEFASN